jgi:hypothetical protein
MANTDDSNPDPDQPMPRVKADQRKALGRRRLVGKDV